MPNLNDYFDQFVRERTYLNNVTPKTREWYETAWKAFDRWQRTEPSRLGESPLITRTDLQRFVVHLQQRGVRPVSCNCWLRAMNAFCQWLHDQGAISEGVRLRPQKLEKRIIRVHDDAALRRIVTFRPKTFTEWRVFAIASTIIDTGCRINELLTMRSSDCDFDNLLLTVYGKGRKERRVPMSVELRKVLFRFKKTTEKASIKASLMFPARDGGKWQHRNVRRSYYCFLKQIGLPAVRVPSAAPYVRDSIPPGER